MNKIEFKYLPIGAVFYNSPNMIVSFTKKTPTQFAPNSEWYADYQLVPFSDVKIGEHIWYYNPSLGLEVNGYTKITPRKHVNAESMLDGHDGQFMESWSVVVHRPTKEQSMNLSDWMRSETLCQLRDLAVGDECLIQGRPSLNTTIFTIIEIHKDTIHIHNDSWLYILRDDRGQRRFITATQQVYRKPVAPPKLMLSMLKTGQYFTFKGNSKEYIKMEPGVSFIPNSKYFYRDSKNQIFSSFSDCEVDFYVPF